MLSVNLKKGKKKKERNNSARKGFIANKVTIM
jgi:hypothetical protein